MGPVPDPLTFRTRFSALIVLIITTTQIGSSSPVVTRPLFSVTRKSTQVLFLFSRCRPTCRRQERTRPKTYENKDNKSLWILRHLDCSGWGIPRPQTAICAMAAHSARAELFKLTRDLFIPYHDRPAKNCGVLRHEPSSDRGRKLLLRSGQQ